MPVQANNYYENDATYRCDSQHQPEPRSYTGPSPGLISDGAYGNGRDEELPGGTSKEMSGGRSDDRPSYGHQRLRTRFRHQRLTPTDRLAAAYEPPCDAGSV